MVCVLAQQLSRGLLSSLSVMLRFHFLASLQVTLGSERSHASGPLLLQTALHAQQLSVEHTEEPLLGLDAGLAAGAQAAEQRRQHVFVDLNPCGLQVAGGSQQSRHFKTARERTRSSFHIR